MIKENNYLNAVVVAKELAAHGISLTTRQASPLGQLLEASASMETVKTTEPLTILANAPKRGLEEWPEFGLTATDRAYSVANVTKNQEEASEHTLRVTSLADDLAPLITSHISFARNTVAPLVVELAGKLEKYLQEARPVDPTTLFEIVQRKLPALATDEVFLNEGLANYISVDAEWLNLNIEFKIDAIDEYLLSLMNMSSERLNGMVTDWLKTKPADFLKKVWFTNFAIPGEGYGQYVTDDHSLNQRAGIDANSFEVLDIALASYIMAKRLMIDVPPNDAKGGLAGYKEMMRNRIDYAGGKAARAVSMLSRQAGNNVVVNEVNLGKKQIVVHRDTYQAWLTNGGAPEVLLGMIASGNVVYSIQALDEAKDELLRQWNNYLMFSASSLKLELQNRFVAFLENEVLLGLNSLSDLEKDFLTGNPGYRQRVAENVKHEIDHLRHRLTEDLYHTALHMVAKARFYFTSSYAILREIAEVAKDNPDIDVREAALLSVLSYLADYCDCQVEIVK